MAYVTLSHEWVTKKKELKFYVSRTETQVVKLAAEKAASQTNGICMEALALAWSIGKRIDSIDGDFS